MMSGPQHIPNHRLLPDKLPSAEADWESIQRFALTFDGYRHWGSAEKCAEIANARQHETLTDLRTCLFFEQRRWRHFGVEPDDEAMEYVRTLVDQIRARVAAGDAPLV